MEKKMMIEFILFISSLIVILTLLGLLVKVNISRRKIFAAYIQSEFDKHLLYQKIEEISKELATKNLAETDGFIKFISESRDWAFQYIEEVQKALTEFDEVVDPALGWAMKFGVLNGETANVKILREISEAYKKLKSVLPENNETPNN
jgi:hypothetical protein